MGGWDKWWIWSWIGLDWEYKWINGRKGGGQWFPGGGSLNAAQLCEGRKGVIPVANILFLFTTPRCHVFSLSYCLKASQPASQPTIKQGPFVAIFLNFISLCFHFQITSNIYKERGEMERVGGFHGYRRPHTTSPPAPGNS